MNHRLRHAQCSLHPYLWSENLQPEHLVWKYGCILQDTHWYFAQFTHSALTPLNRTDSRCSASITVAKPMCLWGSAPLPLAALLKSNESIEACSKQQCHSLSKWRDPTQLCPGWNTPSTFCLPKIIRLPLLLLMNASVKLFFLSG